jgi:hypothetical protein
LYKKKKNCTRKQLKNKKGNKKKNKVWKLCTNETLPVKIVIKVVEQLLFLIVRACYIVGSVKFFEIEGA